MNLLRRLRLLFALASGLLLALAYPPYNVPGAEWFAPAALLFVALQARPWVAMLCGFLHGVAFYAVTLPWIYSVMRVHGGVGPAVAGGLLGLLVLYLSLFPALFGWGVAFLSRQGAARGLLAAPALWVALEFARTHVPILGFPWNLLGYAVADRLLLLQVVSITGIYGLSFVLLGYNALLAWLLVTRTRTPWLAWLLCTGLVLPIALLGERVVPSRIPREEAMLVQTNFPQAPEYPANWMDLHAAEMDELERISIEAVRQDPSSSPEKNLVIWPEVPAPFYFLDPKFAARAERVARESGAHFLVGVVEWRPGPDNRLQPYNSAVLLDPAGQRKFQYDKIHLVPFGEYVPLRRVLKFAESLVAEVGDYQPGSAYAVGQLPGGKFGAFICFEAIFPDEVRRFTAHGAELLINITNDGWYGRSAAPEQHLAIARVRAVENRRWLLRATNNGYTVAIDPYGREVARLAPDIRGVLRAPYSFRSDRTVYSRFGDWFAVACVIVSVGFLAVTILKVKRMEERK